MTWGGGLIDGGGTNRQGAGGLISVSGSGGGAGGTTDTVARAAASRAEANVDAITPNPGEVVAPGQRVYTASGIFENATGSAVTLSATNPATAASLMADGLTPPVQAPTETGTNWQAPATAFADAESPTDAEALTWYQTIAAGDRTADDLVAYASAGGLRVVWAAGDGDGGTSALERVETYDPSRVSGGVRTIRLSASQAVTPDPEPLIRAEYLLAATAPTSDVDGVTAVTYALPAPTSATDTLSVQMDGAVAAYLDGTVNGDATGMIVDVPDRPVKLVAETDLSGWSAPVQYVGA